MLYKSKKRTESLLNYSQVITSNITSVLAGTAHSKRERKGRRRRRTTKGKMLMLNHEGGST